jgi:hypothetical protein
MPMDLPAPNLAISLPLDPSAPRAARYHVAQVDSPSPDLRDAVVLLTSELVSRAVERGGARVTDMIELRVWMPKDVVRVEVSAPVLFLPADHVPEGPDFDGLLFGGLADRWSTAEEHGDRPAMWFEIDRHPAAAPVHSGV